MVAIFVAVTFILAIVIDTLVRKRQKSKVEEKTPIPAAQPAPGFPLGYFFTPGHVWLNLNPSGKLFMGLDELIQRTIGKVSQITLKKSGEKIKKGELLATISQGDKKLHLLSPIDGIIEKTNSELEETPQKFLDSPYKYGWFYSINPENLSEDLKNFTLADKTRTWWLKEMSRLREFVQKWIPQQALAGLTLSDGGVPLNDLVQYFDEKALQEFEASFLHVKTSE